MNDERRPTAPSAHNSAAADASTARRLYLVPGLDEPRRAAAGFAGFALIGDLVRHELTTLDSRTRKTAA
jgi:hypothetical protein